MREQIQARRDALAAQLAQAQQQHTELQQLLHALEHNISAMQGGVQELDALLKEGEANGRETHPQQALRYIRAATAQVAAASEALSDFQVEDEHQHTKKIEEDLAAASQSALLGLAEVEAACAKSPSS